MPETPRNLFRVDRDSGVITVQADSMEGTAPQYTLTITAEDAKGRHNAKLVQLEWHHVIKHCHFVQFSMIGLRD